MSHTKRIWSFLVLLAIASNWESWLNRSVDMDVVRLPIVFNGLGRSLVLHECDAFEPYTLTIPDFELVTEHINTHRRSTKTKTPLQRGSPTHPTAT